MFLAKQNDLICLISDDKQKLEDCGIVFTAIEETDENYVFNGENYVPEKDYLPVLKERKHSENTQKAKERIENGYVVYKDAEFETNAQTVGDLTATMLMLQATHGDSVEWLSKDDKTVELSEEDFVILGGLIADFKNTVWNEKYINYKTLIENSDNIDSLNNITIDYERTNNDN